MRLIGDKLDQVAAKHGISTLRTPPYHEELDLEVVQKGCQEPFSVSRYTVFAIIVSAEIVTPWSK